MGISSGSDIIGAGGGVKVAKEAALVDDLVLICEVGACKDDGIVGMNYCEFCERSNRFEREVCG